MVSRIFFFIFPLYNVLIFSLGKIIKSRRTTGLVTQQMPVARSRRGTPNSRTPSETSDVTEQVEEA